MSEREGGRMDVFETKPREEALGKGSGGLWDYAMH